MGHRCDSSVLSPVENPAVPAHHSPAVAPQHTQSALRGVASSSFFPCRCIASASGHLPSLEVLHIPELFRPNGAQSDARKGYCQHHIQGSESVLLKKVDIRLIRFLFRLILFLFFFSVGHPFVGDYVRLRHNQQWKKVCAETNDQYVVFADIINKIARSSGKVKIEIEIFVTFRFKITYILRSLCLFYWYSPHRHCCCWISEPFRSSTECLPRRYTGCL